MRTIGLCAVLFVVVCALAGAAAIPPGGKQFTTSFVLTAMKDGKRIVLGEPTLVTNEGQEGTFLSGGEAPVDKDGKEFLSFGTNARIKVRQEAPDKLRVSMYAGYGDLDAQGESNFVIREQGVYCVRTVKPGEKIDIDLGGGRAVGFTVNPVEAKR